MASLPRNLLKTILSDNNMIAKHIFTIFCIFSFNHILFAQVNKSNIFILNHNHNISSDFNAIERISPIKQYNSSLYFYADITKHTQETDYKLYHRRFYKTQIDTLAFNRLSFQKIFKYDSFGVFYNIFEYKNNTVTLFTSENPSPNSIESLVSVFSFFKNINFDFFKNIIVYSDGAILYINDFSMSKEVAICKAGSIKFFYSIINPTFSTYGKYITFIYQYPSTHYIDHNTCIYKKIFFIDIYKMKMISFEIQHNDVDYVYFNEKLLSFLVLSSPHDDKVRDIYTYNLTDKKTTYIGKGLSACWVN